MALIKCSECGRQVSTMASACPHCGCPVSMNTSGTSMCRINSKTYNLDSVLPLIRAGNTPDNRLKGVRLIQSLTDLDVGDAKGLWDEMVKIKTVPNSFQTYAEKQSLNLPKCPTCGSTNIEKITAFDRGVAAGVFGMISKTARSQFRCRGCGYLW